MASIRLYAGRQLRGLREARAIRQAEFAAQLGISASYLSQIEHDDRPLTPALLDRLQRLFPLEWEEVAAEAGDRRAGALREAAADPLFAASPLPPEQLERAALQQPQLADQFVALHAASPGSLSRSADLRSGKPSQGGEALRDYGIGAQILAALGIHDMILLTNTRHAPVGLSGYGLSIVEERNISLETR